MTFSGCRPGTIWSVPGERFHVSQYWTLPIEAPLHYRRADEYVEHFQYLLQTAVGDRLRTDRVGVFMSGGLDSPGWPRRRCDILAGAIFAV